MRPLLLSVWLHLYSDRHSIDRQFIVVVLIRHFYLLLILLHRCLDSLSGVFEQRVRFRSSRWREYILMGDWDSVHFYSAIECRLKAYSLVWLSGILSWSLHIRIGRLQFLKAFVFYFRSRLHFPLWCDLLVLDRFSRFIEWLKTSFSRVVALMYGGGWLRQGRFGFEDLEAIRFLYTRLFICRLVNLNIVVRFWAFRLCI